MTNTPGRGNSLCKDSEQAWDPLEASQKWSSFAFHRVCMGRSAFMGGQFPGLGPEPAIERCVRTSRTALGLGAGCCEPGLEDSRDHGCLHSCESLQLTASAVTGRMETKAKYT